MQILTTIVETRAATDQFRAGGASLGLVPTMGAIHQGHLSLVRAARRTCDRVAASIFVNPLQFAPIEHFERYPRVFAADVDLLADAGVDLLFAPSIQEMYPHPQSTFVDVEGIGARLDGASRPGHFRGVATVVLKLFHILSTEVAFFGQKDAAQVAVLRAMVRDLNLPVRMVVCPTLREPSGLAMSSRNRFLTKAQRVQALTLWRSLQAAQNLVAGGETDAVKVRETLLLVLGQQPSLRIDYAEVVDPDTLEPLDLITGDALVAVAVWLGDTRLIDNCLVVPHG